MLNGGSGIRELFQPGTPTTGAPLVECAFMKMALYPEDMQGFSQAAMLSVVKCLDIFP
jgi:hypothetical protein